MSVTKERALKAFERAVREMPEAVISVAEADLEERSGIDATVIKIQIANSLISAIAEGRR